MSSLYSCLSKLYTDACTDPVPPVPQRKDQVAAKGWVYGAEPSQSGPRSGVQSRPGLALATADPGQFTHCTPVSSWV